MDPVQALTSAPYAGPFSLDAILADAVAAKFDGCWIDAGSIHAASLEITGSFSAVSVDFYGSNDLPPPPNGYTVTVGGSVTAADTLTLTIGNRMLEGGELDVEYVPVDGDTTATIAAALAALITASPALAALEISAAAGAAVLTLSYPSAVPPARWQSPSPTLPQPNNATTVVSAVSGGATETLTVATLTNGTKIATLAALGLTAVTVMSRWIKARISALTGASVTCGYHGVGG